ncbi:MAG: helix-turn-helix transcriptional regulator [Candidatus Limnocylindrales bacterium]
MHASRLISVLLLLQTRGRMTARELADELEVSLRTMYRDLDGLAAAGVPVYAERGPAGGYQLVDGYRTRLTGLNQDEAEALFLSGLEGPAAQLGLGTVLAAAQLKVLAALPPELRGRAARLRERFLFVAPRWFRRDEPPAALATVAEGVWASRLLEMTYEGPDGPVERRVEPLGLVLKAGVWYLVARRDHLQRTYRVSRILRATCLPERFERPSEFDLAAHWEATASAFEASTRRLDVLVLVRAEAIDELEYATGADVSVLPPEDARGGAVPTATDGWVRAQFQTSSLETVHDDLLRLGARVEVLGPPELRVRLAATVRAMSVVYGASNR